MEMVVRSRSSPLICQIFISKRLISSGGKQLFGAAIVVYSRVYSPLLSTYHVAAMASIVHQQTRLPANPETQVLPLFLSHSFDLFTARKRHLRRLKLATVVPRCGERTTGDTFP